MIMYMSLIDNEDDKIKFEDIYGKYKKMMFWIANQILNDERDIEEVVQDSFIKIIRNLDKIEKINSNNITKIKLKIIFFIKPPRVIFTSMQHYNIF